MRIYNTLTRNKDELENKGQIKIYACGPTVYNFIHIGNARPLCVFDVLRRYLKYAGYDVKYVQNFTDVDDKLIKKANEEGITVKEVAERYIEEFFIDSKGLNILKADVHPKATENIDAIIELISTLVEKGFAYESKGDVYFRAEKFDEYGKLSHQPLDELQSGARIDINEQKESPMDFALWKAAKPGEPYWQSPWSKGRPGWHIECSAMANRYLGKTIDIHCGGEDLVFPHHENEIAQSECANGCEFAKFWMHNGYINVDNRKMSKSLGNFFTVREVAEKFGYEPIRYIMVASHYRSPINYSVEIIEQAVASLNRLYSLKTTLKEKIADCKIEGGEVPEFLAKYEEEFASALADDLNTADALGTLFSLVKEINILITEDRGINTLNACNDTFLRLADVLGFLYVEKEESVDEEIEKLIAERTEARKNKNFSRADEIRDILKAKGIELLDTKDGVKWRKI